MGRTFSQMVRDRLSKHGWYDTPAYWDMKAETYAGLARSNWPSNTYNRHWNERQMALIDRMLGDVAGHSVADVACGTGRASRHLAARGARVSGFDFAPRTLEAARRESSAEGLDIDFRPYNVLDAPPSDVVGKFDIVLTISCLAMACGTGASFDSGLEHLIAFVKPGGRLLLFEPIHSSRLLKRILRMSPEEWIRRAEARGLRLTDRRPAGFVPARFLLAFRELPEGLVRPAFWAGEQALDRLPPHELISDYQCLLFVREAHVNG